MTNRRFTYLYVFLFVVSLFGCDSNRTKINADTLASAQHSFDQAIAAMADGDHESAAALLDAALIPGGGLPADIYTDARVNRAICFARLDRFDEAHADLDVAAQGAADMATVHVARSFVFKKEGKTSESASEMSAAKKINRKAKSIKG